MPYEILIIHLPCLNGRFPSFAGYEHAFIKISMFKGGKKVLFSFEDCR